MKIVAYENDSAKWLGDSWIAWYGGHMPVNPKTMVMCRSRNGIVRVSPAEFFFWSHHKITEALGQSAITGTTALRKIKPDRKHWEVVAYRHLRKGEVYG
jgi:hypothetical protein